MKPTECLKCGVAFDVGRSHCVELSCVAAKPEKVLVTERAPRKRYYYPNKRRDPIYERLVSVKSRAKKRNIPFSMTQELIQNIVDSPCVYCGAVEEIQLDRKVGELGYTPDNVVPACKRCNTVKSMYLTHAQMMIVAEALGWMI